MIEPRSLDSDGGIRMYSIKKQIVWLFILISVTLIGTIYGAMRMELARNIMPINTKMTQQMVDERGNQIDSWFGERLSELRLLANLPAQHDYNRQQLFKETKALTKFDKHNYVSIRLVSRDGISYSNSHPSFSIQQRSYYREMQRYPQRGYTVSNLLTSKEDHQSIVIILYRLARPLADHTAYVAAAIPLAKVEALAHELSIYDGTGMLLGGDTDSPRINPQRELLLTTKLEQLPRWKVNYVVQKKELRENTQQLIRLLLIIVLVVIALLGLLLVLLLRQIVRPIENLTRTMNQIQIGGHDIRAVVEGPQEIQTLATTFNQTLDRVYENETKYREATIQVLQAQIQPHFLYNTLDTIQWQILGGDTDTAITMIENLSIFFRKGLNHGCEYTTLRNEITHVQSYFKIQAIRFPKLHQLSIDIDDGLMDQPVMHFILQPLVENAINHGLRCSPNGNNELRIGGALISPTRLQLTVSNNGQPMSAKLVQKLNDGSYQAGKNSYGIYNIRHRLQLIYNGQARLDFSSTRRQTTVRVILPLVEESIEHGGEL